jgi:hypothetical protein
LRNRFYLLFFLLDTLKIGMGLLRNVENSSLLELLMQDIFWKKLWFEIQFFDIIIFIITMLFNDIFVYQSILNLYYLLFKIHGSMSINIRSLLIILLSSINMLEMNIYLDFQVNLFWIFKELPYLQIKINSR